MHIKLNSFILHTSFLIQILVECIYFENNKLLLYKRDKNYEINYHIKCFYLVSYNFINLILWQNVGKFQQLKDCINKVENSTDNIFLFVVCTS